MSRYRVTTTRTEVHIVDAHSEAEASATAITLSEARARPAYALGSTAEAEFYADTKPVCEHIFRLVTLGTDGDTPGYRCERCGSTDPEGDQAR